MTIAITAKQAGLSSAAKSKIAGLVAIILGCTLVFVIGFSHIDAVHDAAHDTRHANGFPCH
jgi:cobalt transporter subunit CbtB